MGTYPAAGAAVVRIGEEIGIAGAIGVGKIGVAKEIGFGCAVGVSCAGIIPGARRVTTASCRENGNEQ
jgi:hypothetical protein